VAPAPRISEHANGGCNRRFMVNPDHSLLGQTRIRPSLGAVMSAMRDENRREKADAWCGARCANVEEIFAAIAPNASRQAGAQIAKMNYALRGGDRARSHVRHLHVTTRGAGIDILVPLCRIRPARSASLKLGPCWCCGPDVDIEIRWAEVSAKRDQT